MNADVQSKAGPLAPLNGPITGQLTRSIDQHVFQSLVALLNKYRTNPNELDELYGAVSNHLKKLGCTDLDTYFNQALAHAESDQALYRISDAYETILLAELSRIKKALHVLRTT